MELKPNMYARIDGKIGKVIQICTCEQCEARGYYEPTIEYAHGERDYVSVYWKNNLKASHNIIDLIEVGDYVNGYPVYEIVEYEDNTRAIVIGDDNKSIIWEESSQYIKSIVTKEQFESMSYKVGE